MSGGSVGPFPSGGGSKPIDCESLKINSVVTSPSPQVAAMLKVGDTVNIFIDNSSGYEVVVAEFSGSVLGSLMTGSDKLLGCLQQGFSFAGAVTNIQNGRIDLAISSV